MRHYSVILFSALFLFACSQSGAPEMQNSEAQSPNTHPIISPYSQAWNDKDIQSMSALMHPNIEWISVDGNTIKVEISGKEALVKEMTAWFESDALPSGSLKGWSFNGDYVAVTETAHWTNKEGEAKSQSALTVYQLDNNLIRRVYYYPAK